MRHHQAPSRIGWVAGLLIVAALPACGGGEAEPAPAPEVVIRGTDPASGTPGPGLAAAVVAPDARGVISYDTYKAVVAQGGETVADLAQRHGLSASELAAYNGLTPSHALQAGDELVLPSGPGGYAADTVLAAAEPSRAPTLAEIPTPEATIETAPLPGFEASPDPASAATVPESPAPESAPAPVRSDAWSPDLAAAAIERSSGLNPDGTLAAPPSSSEPVPPEPPETRELESPSLAQYQTGATGLPTPPPTPEIASAAPQVAAPAGPNVRLRRPVQGQVAIGFDKGAGPARNDGVDFAAPAGAPVVAAADGEVALVSQALGGLGTIVLLRHPNDLLTVYGRIDGVTVRKGDIVQAGQQIGVVSNAAAPAEPRMHFEVRRGAESLDPMQFL